MKKKIFILIVMAFLLTGCTNNYNVRLMFDGSIKEESNIRAESETLIGDKKITDSNKEEIVEILKSVKDVLGIDVNLEKVKYNEDSIEYNLKDNYSSFEDYKTNSQIVGLIFKDIERNRKGNSVEIKSIKSDYDINDEYKNSVISIDLPYKVIDSNADQVDGRTYIWNLDDDFDGIYLKYNRLLFSTYNPITLLEYTTINTLLTVIAILILVVAAIIFIKKAIFNIKGLINESR